jgi:hypothetical protein
VTEGPIYTKNPKYPKNNKSKKSYLQEKRKKVMTLGEEVIVMILNPTLNDKARKLKRKK